MTANDPQTATQPRPPAFDQGPDDTFDDLFLNAEPSANYRPGQAKVRTRKSVDHTIRYGVRSMLRSVARRPDFDVPDLTQLKMLHHDLDLAVEEAVLNLRHQGHSWAAIADALGVSRQAAHKRFAAPGESPDPA